MTQLILRQSTGNQFWMNQLGGATYKPATVVSTKRVYQDVASATRASKFRNVSRRWSGDPPAGV